MLTQLYANNAKTTLATGLAPADTTIQVASTAGFPNPGPNEYFRATIDAGIGVEVIYVFGVVGNSFINCQRGQEGTIAQTFQPGTQIEMRVTKGTLEQFARYQDRLAEIASVDDLDSPENSDGNSYICASKDDAGNPIVAIENGYTWRFISHPSLVLSDACGSGSTTTKVAFPNASQRVVDPVSGKYIIQFTSGDLRGLARLVTGANASGITWLTALPSAPAAGDTFEVYQSTTSLLSSLNTSSNDGLIYGIIFSD